MTPTLKEKWNCKDIPISHYLDRTNFLFDEESEQAQTFNTKKFNIIILVNMADGSVDDEGISSVLDQLVHYNDFEKIYISDD